MRPECDWGGGWRAADRRVAGEGERVLQQGLVRDVLLDVLVSPSCEGVDFDHALVSVEGDNLA